MSSLYRIGVDVGGTNTDAAVLDVKALDDPARCVLASSKAATTPDITSGIETAIQEVLSRSQVSPSSVLSVTIGTTHFINALIEADSRRLDRVAVFRLCGPYSQELPPFLGFPPELRKLIDGGGYYLDGGLEMDGREIAPLKPEQIREAARQVHRSGIRYIALVGIHSPLDHQGIHEERCRRIIVDAFPDLSVVCSHEIGPIGFLERENATILNAAILRTGHKVKNSFMNAMLRLRLACPLFLSRNDGTLIDARVAANFPIKTFASGPTNSMTGAAFLAGIREKPRCDPHRENPEESQDEPQVLVVDIGGTTTDICSLRPSGFPRQAPGFVEVAGIRTAFPMPEVFSIGLGGGSKIHVDADGAVSVGPASVGHEIHEQAKIFGGPTLTATDVVAALGKAPLGDASLLKDVPRSTIESAYKEIQRTIEQLISRTRVSSAPVHVILVGGGALLAGKDLKGVDRCIQPAHHGAANAVGAAIARVCGEVDIVEVLGDRQEEEILDEACKRAIALAIEKGGEPQDVRIVEIIKTPLAYMSQVTLRVQVRAAGKLAIPDATIPFDFLSLFSAQSVDDVEEEIQGDKVGIPNPDHWAPITNPSRNVDIDAYTPDVRDGIWYISDVDLELISTGCGILGTGGGGQTHYEYLKALCALRGGGGKGKMRVISPESLKDDDFVYFGSWYGSPSVTNERLSGGGEITSAIQTIAKLIGKPIAAQFIDEIGGGNGMSALSTSVKLGVPVVDGDTLGRAYPTIQHCLHCVNGHSLVPCAITDNGVNMSVTMSVDSPKRLENLMRSAAIELGLACAMVTCPQPGRVIKESTVPNSLSCAWRLGRAVHQAKRHKRSLTDAIFEISAGQLLFSGKITDVRRNLGGGYLMGSVLIAPVDADDDIDDNRTEGGRHMVVPFQNEYIYAALSDSEGSEESLEIVCTVPHLISILGQDGEAVGSQDLRYGLHVHVIALPAHSLWLTEKALKLGGPEGFGLQMDVIGIKGTFMPPRSVIEEFNK